MATISTEMSQQTTANIYTHLKEETLRRASVNMEKVFADREKVRE